MAYAVLTEGMNMEARAAFDLTLNADLDAPAPAQAGPSVAEQNRAALREWAALGVPVPVIR